MNALSKPALSEVTPESDLAMLEFPLDDLAAITLAKIRPTQVGDIVYAIGNALGV
jgi:S1-C subfamily serine protease